MTNLPTDNKIFLKRLSNRVDKAWEQYDNNPSIKTIKKGISQNLNFIILTISGKTANATEKQIHKS